MDSTTGRVCVCASGVDVSHLLRLRRKSAQESRYLEVSFAGRCRTDPSPPLLPSEPAEEAASAIPEPAQPVARRERCFIAGSFPALGASQRVASTDGFPLAEWTIARANRGETTSAT